MAFRASDGSFLSEWYARKQEEFYSHVPVWVAVGASACEAAGRRLTHAEYHGLIELLDGMNSYTRKVLLPVLDDLAVCELASYCMSQSGRELGALDIPRHYNEAVEKELAPLLVKRLRESAAGWEKTLEANQAIKLERLEFQRQLDAARREAAAWEVQCQDLRDKLVQLQATQEAQRKMGEKLADYLDTANGIIEEEGGDEEDIRDARELVAEARVVFGVEAS
jgi:predicted house-cleaning noncanonical NTP pyrophosphatase (MazG superfamily)